MTALVPHLQRITSESFLTAIDSSDLAPSTKQKYRGAIRRAADSDVDLMDAISLSTYARGLKSSPRSFLRGAVRLLADHLALYLKGTATPDNVATIQAMVWRLEALQNAIKLSKQSGQKAHIWLSAGEVSMLSTLITNDTLKGRRDRVIIGLLLGAGLRRSELARDGRGDDGETAYGLRWSQIVMQGDRTSLDVVGKGRKNRSIPISQSLAQSLADFRSLIGAADEDYVAAKVNRGDNFAGWGMSGSGIYSIVRPWGVLIGRPKLAPHDLRRTYLQLGYDAGIPLPELSALAGHASTKQTEDYLNISVNTHRTVSDFIPF